MCCVWVCFWLNQPIVYVSHFVDLGLTYHLQKIPFPTETFRRRNRRRRKKSFTEWIRISSICLRHVYSWDRNWRKIFNVRLIRISFVGIIWVKWEEFDRYTVEFRDRSDADDTIFTHPRRYLILQISIVRTNQDYGHEYYCNRERPLGESIHIQLNGRFVWPGHSQPLLFRSMQLMQLKWSHRSRSVTQTHVRLQNNRLMNVTKAFRLPTVQRVIPFTIFLAHVLNAYGSKWTSTSPENTSACLKIKRPFAAVTRARSARKFARCSH